MKRRPTVPRTVASNPKSTGPLISFRYARGAEELETEKIDLFKEGINAHVVLQAGRRLELINSIMENSGYSFSSLGLLSEYLVWRLNPNRKDAGLLELKTKLWDRFLRNRLNVSLDEIRVIVVEGAGTLLVSHSTFMHVIELVEQLVYCDQYHSREFSSHISGKTVIDAGANVGVFSLLAASQGARKVYAFEPVKHTCDILSKNIVQSGFASVIIPVNAALGEKDEFREIGFDNAFDAAATLNPHAGKLHRQNVFVTSLDNYVKKNRIQDIGFIKADIEGHERFLLNGARRAIKAWKPVIACSAYHLKDDTSVLPAIVCGIRKDYKYRLEHAAEEDFIFY